MFSGIVECMGRVAEIRSEPPGCRLIIQEPKIAAQTAVADSISVDLPRDGLRALRAATQTGGAYLAVSDQAILKAIVELGREAAVFAEPAGAAAYAGFRAAVDQGLIGEGDEVLVLNTGNGLKDVRAAMQATGEADIIEPELTALQRLLAERGLVAGE